MNPKILKLKHNMWPAIRKGGSGVKNSFSTFLQILMKNDVLFHLVTTGMSYLDENLPKILVDDLENFISFHKKCKLEKNMTVV